MKPYKCQACGLVSIGGTFKGCQNDKCSDQWWNKLYKETGLIISHILEKRK